MTGPARRWLSVCLIAVLAGLLGTAPARSAALFEEDFMDNGGYFRQYVSMNLQDIPETLDNDRYNLNMVRSQFLLESDFELARWANVHSRLRAAREHKTAYLEALENPNGADGTFRTADDEMTPFADDASSTVPRNGSKPVDFYERFLGQNDLEVRELYLDLNLTRSTQLRAGKQLMSWGKGSFQRALDLVQGFDNTWAPIVTDEEERRKSTILLNLTTEMPAWGGSLQAYYQPGYDDIEDIGTTNPQFGGRYTANGLRGIDTTEPLSVTGLLAGELLITPRTNENNPGARVDSEKYGLRFRGMGFGNRVEYSLAYLHTHQKSSVSHTIFTPYKADTIPATDPNCPGPTPGGNLTDDIYSLGAGRTDCLESGRRRETIFPVIDVWGGSFNYYSPLLDIVTRGEVAYLKDRVFDRFPSDPALRGSLAAINSDLLSVFSDSIIKDEYRLMLGFDRTAYFVRWLGADRPGLLTVEFFDFIIDDFEENEFVIDTSHGLRKEHTLEYVSQLRWSYANGYYAPSLTVAGDASYGGNWFTNPALTIAPTTNWRITIDGVFVFEDTNTGNEATRYGFNGDGDRITTQVSYQF